MEQKIGRMPLIVATAILGLLAYILRANQLTTAMVQGHLVAEKGWLFNIVAAVVTLAFAVFSWKLRGRRKYAAIASRSLPVMAVSCTASLALFLSSVMLMMKPLQDGDKLIAVVGLLTAVCWAGTALLRYRNEPVHAALFLIPAAAYVVMLICRFRFWTRDPVILDYCFELFALICTMCAVFHLGGYCFDEGKRRWTVFFTLTGIFFSAASIPAAPASRALGYLAAILWLMSSLWILLRPGKKKDA